MRSPTPDEIRAARAAAGHTQTEAAELAYSSRRAWQAWEQGERFMPPSTWAFYLLRARRIRLADLDRIDENGTISAN